MTSLVTFCGFMLGSVGVYSIIIFPSTTDGLPYNILRLVLLHSTVYKTCVKHSNLEKKNNILPRFRQRLSKWHFDFRRLQKQFCNNTPFRCMFSFPIMLITKELNCLYYFIGWYEVISFNLNVYGYSIKQN